MITARASNVISELQQRGLIAQSNRETARYYAGIDPTAQSIHLGNLVMLQSLLHFYIRGHTTIALMGGATGAIGDPSGRSTERNMLTNDVITTNLQGIEAQVRRFFERGAQESDRVKVLNNISWLGSISGRHMRIGSMLARDSFTEFSYQLLQSYDFWHLFQHHQCRVQIGGSDQWGNITAGIDYIHRRQQAEASSNDECKDKEASDVYGLTIPLLTTANGQKFGKSAGNAIWLNEEMTSYYDFYQFFMKVDDNDVERYLKIFTFLNLTEINTIIKEHQTDPDKRYAQRRLADEVTELIHGEHGLKKAQTATRVLFDRSLHDISAIELINAFEHDPRFVSLPLASITDTSIGQLAHKVNACSSRSAANKLIQSGGLYLNNRKISDIKYKVTNTDLLDDRVCVLRTGKSNYRIIAVEH
ncbi:hypothetical protein BDF22DRAFT_725121 [Syncephalis plumigaleata]|nr:hypothetical protein BDF22DRAFT_725121 [Syncephalis plumigaleata]